MTSLCELHDRLQQVYRRVISNQEAIDELVLPLLRVAESNTSALIVEPSQDIAEESLLGNLQRMTEDDNWTLRIALRQAAPNINCDTLNHTELINHLSHLIENVT
jgi:hypothetical protein